MVVVRYQQRFCGQNPLVLQSKTIRSNYLEEKIHDGGKQRLDAVGRTTGLFFVHESSMFT
jgi:hypothetical protein